MKNTIKNTLKSLTSSNNETFFIISGPCAIESEYMALKIAEKLVSITTSLNIPFVFKGSFKKANRSRLDSFSGIGDLKALKILQKVRETFKIPTLTDIHEVSHVDLVNDYVDVLQIPAFLARQTDLLVAAAMSNKLVNIKKGQFMSADAMRFAVDKIHQSGNNNTLITERGSMFGYGDLIVDFRGVPTMRKISPTVLDVTHSLQKPNQLSGVTGGLPELIETIAIAGIATKFDGLFIETHFDTKNAKSDGANMLDLKLMEDLLCKLVKIRKVVNEF